LALDFKVTTDDGARSKPARDSHATSLIGKG
jgi:hypothetical protein